MKSKNIELDDSLEEMGQGFQFSFSHLLPNTSKLIQYDHTMARVAKGPGSGSATTTYPNIYYNVGGSTTTRQVYTPGGGELIATLTTKGASTTKQYVHTDWLGGTNIVSDDTGKAVQTLDYYPYGSERINTGSFKETRKFIGQESDSEGSLSYLNNRYYEAGRGQFLSEDPVFWEIGKTDDGKKILTSPQQSNSYSYAGNNPITGKDPQGRILDTIADLGFIAYDIYKIGQAMNTGGNVKQEVRALGLDSAAALLPGVTGLGMMARMADRGLGKVGEQSLQVGAALLKGVENTKLQNIIKGFYQTSDNLPGGTAGAVVSELQTGEKVGGKSHIEKAQGYLRGLDKILNNSNSTSRDVEVANTLKESLKKAFTK